jgi:hypothetical protein
MCLDSRPYLVHHLEHLLTVSSRTLRFGPVKSTWIHIFSLRLSQRPVGTPESIPKTAGEVRLLSLIDFQDL